MNSPLTRRRLIAAVGGVGFLTAGSRAASAAMDLDPVTFTQFEQVDGGAMPDVLLNWRETYNGDVLEASGFSNPPSAGPEGLLIDVADVLPGDAGTVTFQVELGEGETEQAPDAARVLFAPVIYENAENGVNEPERDAGDVVGSAGDLDDALTLGLRYDGGCNGTDLPIVPDDTRVHPDVAKSASAGQTIREVASILSDGVELTPPSGSCFQVGESTCLTVEWALPKGVGNRVQGDSLGFLFRFSPQPCEQ